jgi:methylamine--corrinoid protein Co-methyltransferase
MSYQRMLETLDKAETGPIYEEKEFDKTQIGLAVQDIIKRYEISWPADVMVPADDALADRLFEAGLTLAEESGLFCVDTRRRMMWTRNELLDNLANNLPQIKIGTGNDEVTIKWRHPDKDSRIPVSGGAYGVPVPEDLYVPVMLSYAQETSLDFIEGPMLTSTYGRPPRANSPWEVVWSWQEKNLAREAAQRAGRPGIAIGTAVGSASHLGELSTMTYGGFRQTDKHHLVFTSELKVNYAELIKATHFMHTGATVLGYYNPIFGGYGGGVEGMAILMVAGQILLDTCFHTTIVNAGPGHAHLSCNSFPAMLSGQALAFQALSRNTNLLFSSFLRPTAGPCVPHIFEEIAAIVIASAPSGIAFIEGVHTATGRYESHCSGLEARFMAEITHAAEKLTRDEADSIVKLLAKNYAEIHKAIQKGKPFTECYDLETLSPTEEWNHMYLDAIHRMNQEYGIDIAV